MRIMFFIFVLFSYGTSAQEFSISTQNLWHYPINYSHRVESLKDNLRTDLADIASFQEAFVTGLNGEISLLHEFLDYTGYVHRFHKTSEKFHFYEGLAIAGRYPIVSNEVKQYVLPHDSKKRPRRMLLVPFKIAGETIYVFNLHLSPFPKNVHLREDQLKYVVSIIVPYLQARKPVVVMGDFNQDYHSDFFAPLFDLKMKMSLTPDQCTFCRGNKYSIVPHNWRFDYIFYSSDQLEIIKSYLINVENPISDHYGIKAEFKLK